MQTLLTINFRLSKINTLKVYLVASKLQKANIDGIFLLSFKRKIYILKFLITQRVLFLFVLDFNYYSFDIVKAYLIKDKKTLIKCMKYYKFIIVHEFFKFSFELHTKICNIYKIKKKKVFKYYLLK